MLLKTSHCECFTTACLAVGETGDDTEIEDTVNDRLKGICVDILCGFLFGKSIVELEIMIFNVFRDAVYFEFRFVNSDNRI